MNQPLDLRDRYVRYGCLLMIAAVGLSVGYASLWQTAQFTSSSPHWTTARWIAGFLLFVGAYLATFKRRVPHADLTEWSLLALQALAALFLVWLHPSFITTCLIVVVAWQLGWSAPLRPALAVALAQSIALAAMKCAGQTPGLTFLILIIACAFQAFAISAASLARSEGYAREELSRVIAELRATQALVTESARMTERLRISRDLHDVLGHTLTILTIQLDVASRLVPGQAGEHVRTAREVAGNLLTEVRSLVSRIRVEPIDLRAVLKTLADSAAGLDVQLVLPENLPAMDAARADAIVRCVQESVTNTLRHAHARTLTVELTCAPDGSVTIRTRDDGSGGPIVEGSGLAGMRERFEMLGGSLSVAGAPGKGLEISGALP
jgi:signal transduction histidine kinase